MGTRRKSRELCLQMLFQWDMGKQAPEHVKKTFWVERDGGGPGDAQLCRRRVSGGD